MQAARGVLSAHGVQRRLLDRRPLREARKPLTLAANMNPRRRDYAIYRDRARKAA